eukprot:TRINITY_DN596_c0_g1_i1.p1 TRINITY_DN596_c0_g1~~TRINITY_DN596_c0_g1_i1.p1  ORF type:complete len:256 (+),score=107.76 TRINITY_DN596_c0_g1_i1:85-852(+)
MSGKTVTVVLLRHGESTWNKENRFTGWADVPLSEKGLEEAKAAGRELKAKGFTFDVAFTSVLSRAIKTLWLALEEMGLMYIPVHPNWRLNERMYGALQGLDKSETAAKHGEEQVKVWRRAYAIPPPALTESDQHYPGNDARYKGLKPNEIPKTECLKDTVDRFLPAWHNEIVPQINAGKKVLITAHGNSLRALIKYLDNVSDDEIVELNVPTGIPLVYELDAETLKPVKKSYYLGDEEAVKAAQSAVANQGKKKE